MRGTPIITVSYSAFYGLALSGQSAARHQPTNQPYPVRPGKAVTITHPDVSLVRSGDTGEGRCRAGHLCPPCPRPSLPPPGVDDTSLSLAPTVSDPCGLTSFSPAWRCSPGLSLTASSISTTRPDVLRFRSPCPSRRTGIWQERWRAVNHVVCGPPGAVNERAAGTCLTLPGYRLLQQVGFVVRLNGQSRTWKRQDHGRAGTHMEPPIPFVRYVN
jgi:hypothetical protein